MRATTRNRLAAAGLAGLAAFAWTSGARAERSFGNDIDSFCVSQGLAEPIQSDCSVCHTGSYGNRVDPEWTWWFNGRTSSNGWIQFCGAPAPNGPPNGTIAAPTSNQTIMAGSTVAFRGTGSDPDGDPLSYRWSFAGGSPSSSTAQNPSVSYATPGTYTATLVVSDNQGNSDATPPTRSITVLQPNRAPDGAITAPAGNVTIIQGDAVDFRGSGSDPDGNPLSYSWNFGGAAPNSGSQNPGSVSFGSVGTFTVTLTVSDNQGAVDPTPASVRVTVQAPAPTNNPPNGTINAPAQDVVVVQGEPVSFAASATDPEGDAVTFSWNFGGAAPNSTSQNPGSITFNALGTFTVTLVATDSNGAADPTPAIVTVTVMAPPPSGPCSDVDGDLFSPEGGICGPVDCNDRDPTVNPGVDEVCGDGIDNDCDSQADSADAQCNGSDCIGALLEEPLPELALQLSQEPDGNPAAPLAGAVVSGDIYVRIPAEPGIVQVRFYLDGQLRQTENVVPWDFAGTASGGIGRPFDTTTVDDGMHEILAEVDLQNGETLAARATFRVANATGPQLQLSLEADREPAGLLEGSTASGAIYVFVPAEPGIVQVRFFLDGQLRQTERRVPWDFAGTASSGVGNAFDTNALSNGAHQIRAEVAFESGDTVEALAGFTVDNGVALTIAIDRASWNAREQELKVEGRWPDSGASVTVSNAVTGDVLGTTSVRFDDGQLGWEFERERLASVPCRVRVEIAGQFGEADVANAPADCVGGSGGGGDPTPEPEPEPVNRSPVAGNDTATTNEDQAVSINVLANDSDPDGDSLTVSAVGAASLGSVQQSGNTLVYTPAANRSGSDSFSYTIGDGRGGSASATVTVTVRPVNDAPVAVNDSATTAYRTAVTIDVLANDSDIDSATLSVSAVGSASGGSVVSNGNSVTYTPASTFSGTDSFGYTVSDGQGGTATATVSVTVQSPPPPPVESLEVDIEEASWSRWRRRLEVEGEHAPRGARVEVFNARSGALLGTTTVGSDEWEVRVIDPSPVPCRVRVEMTSGDRFGSAERAVSRAPSDCR